MKIRYFLQNLVNFCCTAFLVVSCGGNLPGDSGATNATQTPAGATTTPTLTSKLPLPDVPTTTGQLVVTLDTPVEADSLTGYVVGKQSLLKVEQASTGEYYINNVPPGTLDIIVTAKSQASSLMSLASYFLDKDNTKDIGVRLHAVEVLSGIRTTKESVVLPALASISGSVTLTGQSDQAGILVYIPGTEYSAHTATNGTFSMSAVPSGLQNFYFEHNGFYRGQLEEVTIAPEAEYVLTPITLLVDTGADGTIVLAGGASEIDSRTVPITIAASEDAVVMKIAEDNLFTGKKWIPVASATSYTFETTGQKTLYVKFANANGLDTSPYSASIFIDLFPSEEGAVLINDGTASTNVRTVSVNVTKPTNATFMKLSESADFVGASWIAAETSTSFTFSGEGNKTLYIKFKDNDNYDSAAWNDSIIVDETAPVFTLSDNRSTAEQGGQCTSLTQTLSIGINLSSLDAQTIKSMKIGTISNWANAQWETFNVSKTVTRTDAKQLKVQVKDIFERESQPVTLAVTCVKPTLACGGDGFSGVVSVIGDKAVFAASGCSSATIFSASTNKLSIYGSFNGAVTWPGTTATTVLDGQKLLVTGGCWVEGYSPVEIYSASTDSWSKAFLSSKRYGTIPASSWPYSMFAGGSDSSGVIDIYSALTGNWTVASLSQTRSGFVGAGLDGHILFAGGSTWNGTKLKVVDIFNGTTGQWTAAELSVARSSPNALTAGHKILFYGGQIAGADLFEQSRIVDVYDTVTQVWSSNELPQNIQSTVIVNQKVLFIPNSPADQIQVFDASTAVWSTATMPLARTIQASKVINNKVFFIGGYLANSQYSDRVDIWDSSTNTWTLATMPTTWSNIATAAAGTKLLIAKSDSNYYTSCSQTGSVNIYDTQANTWSSASLTQDRNSINAVVVGTKAIFAGGSCMGATQGGETRSVAIDIYDSSTNTWLSEE